MNFNRSITIFKIINLRPRDNIKGSFFIYATPYKLHVLRYALRSPHNIPTKSPDNK